MRESSVVSRELEAFAANNISIDWSWKNKLAARFPEMAAVQLENKANKELPPAATAPVESASE